MVDSSAKLKLYKPVYEAYLTIDIVALDGNQVVPKGGILHADLSKLKEILDQMSSEGVRHKWWVAAVDCFPEQVLNQGKGWYQALVPIVVSDEYIPLSDALEIHSVKK